MKKHQEIILVIIFSLFIVWNLLTWIVIGNLISNKSDISVYIGILLILFQIIINILTIKHAIKLIIKLIKNEN